MNLRRVLDRKGMYIYPWYISDLTVTKDIVAIAPTNVEKVFVVIKNIYSCADDLLSFCRESIGKDIEKMSDEELLSVYKTYTEKLRTLRTWGWVPPILDGMTDPFLSEHLLARFGEHMMAKGFPDKESEYYSTLSSSEKESEVQGEEIARLALAQTISNDERFQEIIGYIKASDEEALREKFPSLFMLFE